MQLERPQRVIVGGEHLRPLAHGALQLGAADVRRDAGDDLRDDAVLHLEELFGADLHLLGPERRAGRGLAELARHPHRAAQTADAAGQHVAHPEPAPDLARIGLPAAVEERRGARDHHQLAQAGERHDDVLDDAVGEVLVLRIAAEIPERQHRDRGQRRLEGRDRNGERGPRRIERIGAHRPFEVLQPQQAEVAGGGADRAAQQLPRRLGQDDAAGRRVLLQPRREVDAVAVDVAAAADHLADVDRDPERDEVLGALGSALLGDRRLHGLRPFDRVERARELRQHAVAGRLDDHPMVPGGLGRMISSRIDIQRACVRRSSEAIRIE